MHQDNPAGNCVFKVNNRNTRTRCEICSKLTIKTPERRQCRLGNLPRYKKTFNKDTTSNTKLTENNHEKTESFLVILLWNFIYYSKMKFLLFYFALH